MAYLILFLVLVVVFIWLTGWYGVFIILLGLIILAYLSKNDSKEQKKENEANRIKREYDDRVTKIAEYFLKNNVDENKIESAKGVVSLYETKAEYLHNTLKDENTQYLDEKNSFFTSQSNLEKYRNQIATTKVSIINYEMENKGKYEASLSLLKSFDFSFYEKNKAAIKKKMIDIKQREEKKQSDSKESMIKNLRVKAIEKCESVQKRRNEEEKQNEYDTKVKKASRSIDEINGFIVPLKNQVIKKQPLESQVFKILEDHLDIVFDNLDYLNSRDFKKIERIEDQIEDVFAKENSGHFDVEKKQIMDLFSQIIESINKKSNPELEKETKSKAGSINTFFDKFFNHQRDNH